MNYLKSISTFSWRLAVLVIWAKYYYPAVSHDSWPYLFKYYGNNILFYQFYFILGGWAWINYEPLTKWLLQKRSWFSR
ncbi:hypothetical protein [Lactobacillus delbrueckii]|uniref:hypothetical protein n=1 Tax=Lactobacillus delbrueckii TaxID=1584 RepID=UPI000230D9EE|nr:hypothetical protein [Lactobacillus delbrueckii]EHE89774.1 hypothetical protein LDBUL1632_00827 [Lactobacillus delbrueckii subsp. bulgaricus CNCM I-1632]MBS4915031.1 hypothetical protein [Lactobacillus delbrueckii]MBT8938289.1 hypothetical protein [Lactobacillus delbrueckii subsp. bulgaricus]MCD5464915.1 hypothetical protein [Lactobacillus delbrueckii subsp. bulgaricus]MCT3468575.1 hypothetical protein [Lactobacillus delbrueckii subsp. bulgaricus]